MATVIKAVKLQIAHWNVYITSPLVFFGLGDGKRKGSGLRSIIENILELPFAFFILLLLVADICIHIEIIIVFPWVNNKKNNNFRLPYLSSGLMTGDQNKAP